MLYIMLAGYHPFYEQNERELYRKIQKGQFQFHEMCWSRISEEAKDLIRSLLTVDPDERITTEAVLEHPWIKGDAEKLQNNDLRKSLVELKKFNAKRKMKAAVQAIMVAQTLPCPSSESLDNAV